MAPAGVHLGTVTAFDPDRGIGTVSVRGNGTWPFHCTAITDGSRTIEVGTDVAFLVGAHHLGKEEARAVTPLAAVKPRRRGPGEREPR